MDLNTANPREIAAGAAFTELLEALRELEDIGDRPARTLDYVYRHRLARLIGQGPKEELEAASEHLSQVIHRQRRERLDALDKPYGARWEAFRDLAESRLSALEHRDVSAVMSRVHVVPILRLLGDGETTQAEIREHRGLRAANLTRILNLMEANELVQRTAVGRENRVAITDEGRRQLAALDDGPRVPDDAMQAGARVAPDDATSVRGATLFAWRCA